MWTHWNEQLHYLDVLPGTVFPTETWRLEAHARKLEEAKKLLGPRWALSPERTPLVERRGS